MHLMPFRSLKPLTPLMPCMPHALNAFTALDALDAVNAFNAFNNEFSYVFFFMRIKNPIEFSYVFFYAHNKHKLMPLMPSIMSRDANTNTYFNRDFS